MGEAPEQVRGHILNFSFASLRMREPNSGRRPDGVSFMLDSTSHPEGAWCFDGGGPGTGPGTRSYLFSLPLCLAPQRPTPGGGGRNRCGDRFLFFVPPRMREPNSGRRPDGVSFMLDSISHPEGAWCFDGGGPGTGPGTQFLFIFSPSLFGPAATDARWWRPEQVRGHGSLSAFSLIITLRYYHTEGLQLLGIFAEGVTGYVTEIF